MSDFNIYVPQPDQLGCYSWFNLSELPPLSGGCGVNFCKTIDSNCVAECVDIFVKNRTNTLEIGDKVYVLENGIYVLLPMGRYVSSTLGVHFFIGSDGTLTEIVNCSTGSVVRDADGNYYSTVEINGLIWFKENLRTTKYSDGTPILGLSGDGPWRNDKEGSYAVYPNSCFGFLYNWYAVDNAKGLCPTGWRVPTFDELKSLRNAYGGTLKAGRALKVQGDVWWENTNTKTTNISGFSAYPSGSRDFKGGYEYLGKRATFWSSTTDTCEGGAPNAFQLYCCGILTDVADFQCDDKNNGYAVRCVQN